MLTEHTFLFFFRILVWLISVLIVWPVSFSQTMCLILPFKIGISGVKPLSGLWVIFEIGNLEIQVKPNYILNDSTLQYGVCMRIKSYHYSMVSACVLSPM